MIIEIATPTTSSSSGSANSSSTSSSTANETTKQTVDTPVSSPDVLGISFPNPNHVSDEINTSGILNETKTEASKITNPAKQILNGLLIASAGVVAVASVGLATTFFLKPTPK